MLQVVVKRVTDEAIGIRSFELVDRSGAGLPAFTAGSHIDVQVPGGPMRQYSISSDPADRQSYVIAVKREPASRGGSAGMFERVGVGDTIEIGAPRNNFALADDDRHSFFFAGGIGITPILSMVRSRIAAKRSFDLHYFARSDEHMAFRAELVGLSAANSIKLVFASEAAEVEAYARDAMRSVSAASHLYTCGPGSFMDLICEVAGARLSQGNIHLERFAKDPAGPAGPQAGFEVVLAKSDRKISVGDGESIVEALAREGIDVEVSCEQGICGTCLTTVLEGIPDHKDMFLLDDEKDSNTKMCICVSRSKTSQITLEI